MPNCYLCDAPDAQRQAIIKLLKPPQAIKTGLVAQTNPF